MATSSKIKASNEASSEMETWEKRVLLTTLLAHAYDVVCKKWDFEKMGSKQGMRLTRDEWTRRLLVQ